MKTPRILAIAGLLAAISPNALADLKVHEWGTFTVLEGSDGVPIEWYQAPSQLIDLPPFVNRGIEIAGKSGVSQWARAPRRGSLDMIRMETPVLYFYPDKEMEVIVSAAFPDGRITEVFPPAYGASGNETIWKGMLLPPNSPERTKIPASTGPRGRHYGAAREVPDAWLFRGSPRPPKPAPGPLSPAKKVDPARAAGNVEEVRKGLQEIVIDNASLDFAPFAKPTGNFEPIDHFIFYRGAGNRGGFEITAVQSEQPDTFTLTNTSGNSIPKLFALKVSGGQTSWVAMQKLEPIVYFEGKILNQQTLTFPPPAGSTAEVAAKLRIAMVDALFSEGLTKPEAEAMVATWDDLWFTEPGVRVLAVLPREFADRMVPIKISPTPNELDRVFVGRIEIITREQERSLVALLNAPAASQDTKVASAQFKALNLGRFAAGGLERAATLVKSAMNERFQRLNAPEQVAGPGPANPAVVGR